MRGVAILPACENAPVASSKISALLSALPSSTSEKFLTVARPLKPPSSSTWVGESAAAAASARLDVALPVRKNWPDEGSKNSALARLRRIPRSRDFDSTHQRRRQLTRHRQRERQLSGSELLPAAAPRSRPQWIASAPRYSRR